MKKEDLLKKRAILTLVFLAIFITGTALIFTIPISVKSTYGLTTQTKDGVTISFNVFEPREDLYKMYNGDAKKKAVIIGHGYMANKEMMKGYAIELANAGFVVVPLDFRGHGQSLGTLSRDALINDVEAIKAYLSSRDDIDIHNLGYIGYSMGGMPGVEIVKQDADFKCFIGVGTGLPSASYYPGYAVKVSSGRKLNVLMILDRFDEVVTLQSLKEGMALRLGVKPGDIDVNKLYGSFQAGTASMIFLDDNTNHLLLVWDQDFIREARNWVISTFPSVRQPDENLYVNIRAVILLIQVIGGIGLFFLIVDPISNFILKKKGKEEDKEPVFKIDLPDISAKTLSIRTMVYSLVLGIVGILIFMPIALQLSTAGNIMMLLFGQMVAILILLWRVGKKANLSLKGTLVGPFKRTPNYLGQILLGVILGIILELILYISIGLNYYALVPSIAKIALLPILFIIGYFIFLIFSILFNAILQNKIANGLKGQIKTTLLIFGFQIIYLAFYILIFCILLYHNFFNFGVYMPIAIPTTLLSSFITVRLYKKTGNVNAGATICTIYICLMLAVVTVFGGML
jgi:pimeloyl-ACP methyl ester carboxylesterase